MVVVFVLRSALAEQNFTLHTQNISNRSHPWQPSLPAIRVVITVLVEEIAQPEIFTVSGPPKAINLEILRSGLSATASKNLSHSVLDPRLHPQSKSIFYPCSATDAAQCRRGKLPLQSNRTVNSSQTIPAEFAGSAALSKLQKVKFMLCLVVSLLTLRVRMSMM